MNNIFFKQILPFIFIFLLLIFVTIFIDYIFHFYNFNNIGFYLSFAGAFLIIISFVYSLRKRKIIKSGSPKSLLLLHEYLSWIGALLILIHGGIHFNAWLAWIATTSMIIAVASGLTGKFLLVKATNNLAKKLQQSSGFNTNKDDVQKRYFFEILAVDIMKKWRKVHIPVTSVFFILALIHIIISVILREW